MNVSLGMPYRYVSRDDARLHAGLRQPGGYVALCDDLDEEHERYGGWGTWAAEISVEEASRRLREASDTRPVCETCIERLQDLRDPVSRLADVAS